MSISQHDSWSEHLHAALGWGCQAQPALAAQVRAVAAAAAQGMGARPLRSGAFGYDGQPLHSVQRPCHCVPAAPMCTLGSKYLYMYVVVGGCMMMGMPCAAYGCMPCAARSCMLSGAGTHLAWRAGVAHAQDARSTGSAPAAAAPWPGYHPRTGRHLRPQRCCAKA